MVRGGANALTSYIGYPQLYLTTHFVHAYDNIIAASPSIPRSPPRRNSPSTTMTPPPTRTPHQSIPTPPCLSPRSVGLPRRPSRRSHQHEQRTRLPSTGALPGSPSSEGSLASSLTVTNAVPSPAAPVPASPHRCIGASPPPQPTPHQIRVPLQHRDGGDGDEDRLTRPAAADMASATGGGGEMSAEAAVTSFSAAVTSASAVLAAQSPQSPPPPRRRGKLHHPHRPVPTRRQPRPVPLPQSHARTVSSQLPDASRVPSPPASPCTPRSPAPLHNGGRCGR